MEQSRAIGTESELDEYRSATLFGDRIAFREFGERGPVVVLLHGMGGNGNGWDTVLSHLTRNDLAGPMTLVVPDLLGHGRSARPRTDYSPGAHANVVRDLLDELGHQRAILVGHSLGGGIALQFAYQYPDRCEGLVLVSSGGLGGEVTRLLRTMSLPGSEVILRLLATCSRLRQRFGAREGRLGRVFAARDGGDAVASLWRSLSTTEARAAFLATLRAVVDSGGQRVSALQRLPASGAIPILLVWGDRDSTIPVVHAYHAHSQVPNSTLIVFPGAGHYPHQHDPVRFAGHLHDFVLRAAQRTRVLIAVDGDTAATGESATVVDAAVEGTAAAA